MGFDISISFGKSLTADYANAIEYASLFENFTPISAASKLNILQTTNNEILERYDLFQMLITVIGAWESARVSYRDTETDPVSFYLSTKDIAECCLEYTRSKDREAFCDGKNANCWGCRQLTGIILNHQDASYHKHTRYWYQYGAFTNRTTWRINKEEITQSLTDIANEKRLDFCPIFQPAMFRKLIAALPSTLDLNDTKHWSTVYLDEVGTDLKQWKPINVSHKTAFVTPVPTKKPHVRDAGAADNAESNRVAENILLRNIPETSFTDVGGIEDIIQSIREVIELPIKMPDLYAHLGIKPYRGILLWGEPGNGKTLIAKAIAHELNAHFIPIAGPDILNKSFGESEKNLRDIFESAREKQPAIVFIDEIDSIAQARLAGETSKWYATVVNQLLSLMDGISEFGNVTVMASTNRPDLLDPALLRPGRFDYKLEIKRPNLHGCKEILEIVTKGMPLADDVDLFSFAEAVIGFSAAEITFIAREAALVAIRRTMDIKLVIQDEITVTDYSNLYIKRSDFFSALVILKKNSKHTIKTYSLKG